MSRLMTALALSLVVLLFSGSPSMAATACADLARLSLPNTTITLAHHVEAGAFTPPPPRGGVAPGGGANPFANLPAFCRVQATLRPSADSDIKMELWMPVAASWNGKFRGTGNGGLRSGCKCQSTGKRCPAWVRHSGQQHRTRRRLQLCHRSPGKDQRLRIPRRSRDDCRSQSADQGVLRRAAQILPYGGRWRWNDRRSQRCATLSRRLRRDRRDWNVVVSLASHLRTNVVLAGYAQG